MALEFRMDCPGHQGKSIMLVFHSKVPANVLQEQGPTSGTSLSGEWASCLLSALGVHGHCISVATEVAQSTFRRSST
jgi:hypothetical protein